MKVDSSALGYIITLDPIETALRHGDGNWYVTHGGVRHVPATPEQAVAFDAAVAAEHKVRTTPVSVLSMREMFSRM